MNPTFKTHPEHVVNFVSAAPVQHRRSRILQTAACARSGVMSWLVAVIVFVPAAPSLAQTLPTELSGWKPATKSMVFTGQQGQWDSLIRERGWIINDGRQYHLWYTGYDPSQSPVTMKLGYATSRDGISWHRHPDNPVFDDAWTEDMMVVRQGDTFFMFAEGAQDQAQLLQSTDGINWNRIGALDVRLVSGDPIPEGPYGTPTAWYEDGTWHLFYERRDQGIWLATSQDMKIWINVSDEPIIVPGPDNYDRLLIAMNQVIKHEGRYYAVLHGTGTPTKPRDWCTYLAVSDDLVSWVKCADGPVLPVEDNKSSGVLVRDGAGYRLYTMHAKVQLHVNQNQE